MQVTKKEFRVMSRYTNCGVTGVYHLATFRTRAAALRHIERRGQNIGGCPYVDEREVLHPCRRCGLDKSNPDCGCLPHER